MLLAWLSFGACASMREPEFASPLLQVISDPQIHLVLDQIRSAVNSHSPLVFSPSDIERVRDGFTQALIQGEKQLHRFSKMLLEQFSPPSECNVCLNVFGRCANEDHPRLLKQEAWFTYAEFEVLVATLDDSLTARQYTPWCVECNRRTRSIASNTEYYPSRQDQTQLVFLRTRIKTTSNVAFKIADVVLDIDLTFKRDKVYNRYSQQIKDLYGIKCVVETDADILSTRDLILKLPDTTLIEEKDYTGAQRKKSGFEAYKLVAAHAQQVIEVQIQSNRMYDAERLSWSTSHRTYKEAQMQLRHKLGKEYRSVYEAILHLFSDSGHAPGAPLELISSQKGIDDEF